tara:strand:+ start:428 stop:1096 length:669 start_codon:yes stop_codon:yes gene_type:complete
VSNIKLVHSGGNSVSLTTPDSNPAANRTFKLPGADGTSGQAMVTDGSGGLSFANTLKNFGTTTISSAQSEVDIDFDVTNYSNFKLMLEGWNPSADCNMYCRFKINGSISTGSNYCSLTIKKYAGGFDSNEYGGANQNYGYMTHNVGGNDGTYETYSAQLEIMTGSGTGMPFMNLSTMYKDNNATYAHNEGVVAWQNHNQIQGIRIYPSTGTITAGKYTLYGF